MHHYISGTRFRSEGPLSAVPLTTLLCSSILHHNKNSNLYCNSDFLTAALKDDRLTPRSRVPHSVLTDIVRLSHRARCGTHVCHKEVHVIHFYQPRPKPGNTGSTDSIVYLHLLNYVSTELHPTRRGTSIQILTSNLRVLTTNLHHHGFEIGSFALIIRTTTRAL